MNRSKKDPQGKSSIGRSILKITFSVLKFFWHPVMAVVLITFISLRVGEFFPFSNFPMYSNPSTRAVDYHYVTDAGGNPLPIEGMSGYGPPKIKKMLRTSYNARAKELGLKHRFKLSEEEKEILASEILVKIRENAKRRNQKLPDTIRLIEVMVTLDEKGFVETPSLLAEHHRDR